MENTLLLTWTPPAAPVIDRSRLAARVYRTASNRWLVLIRDTVYDGTPKPRFVSHRDFDFVTDALAWAQDETGKAATVSFAREVSLQDGMRLPRSF